MNELQNVTINTPAIFNFHSKLLNDYSSQIATIGATMASSNRQIAVILAKVAELSKDSFEQDGFKGVGDYAEKTFGIAKAMTSQLVKVGKRFYIAPTDTAKAVAEMFTPSNLAEVADMTDEELNAKIADGKISKGKTQKELREVAKAVKDSREDSNAKPAKVQTAYDFRVHIVVDDEPLPVMFFANETIDTLTTSIKAGQIADVPASNWHSAIVTKLYGKNKTGGAWCMVDPMTHNTAVLFGEPKENAKTANGAKAAEMLKGLSQSEILNLIELAKAASKED